MGGFGGFRRGFGVFWYVKLVGLEIRYYRGFGDGTKVYFFVVLQEVDPCDDLSDEDIRTAIQNATGPKNVLFVPEVCIEIAFCCIFSEF